MASFPQAPLGLKAEVYLGSWTDFSALIYQRNQVLISRGRQNESAQMSPSQATMTLNNRDGRWTIRNPAGPWYGQLVQSSPVRLSVPSSLVSIPCYLRMETDNLSYASAPDTASLQITSGTLSVRADVIPSDNRSGAFLGKWGTTGKAWVFAQNNDGTITLFHWDGSNQFSEQSTLPLPYFGQRIAVRADYNISAKTITYYTAATMAGTWTQLGTVVPTTAAALSGAAGQIVQVGAVNSTGMLGAVLEAQIYSTASLVADPVFTSQTPGATSFTDAQANTWTIAGTAELSGRLYRFHGELAQLPKASDPSGTDVYSDATASGVLRRLQQAQAPAYSPLTRAYQRLSPTFQLAGAWPCEDTRGSTQLAATVGGIPGTATPAVNLAASTAIPGSTAIPVINSGQMNFVVSSTGITWTDNDVEFCFAVPSGDDTNGALACRIYTQGTVARMDLIYNTGGVLTLNGYNADGSTNFTSGPQTLGLAALAACRIKIALTASGTAWWLQFVYPGAALGTQFTGSFTGTIGAVTQVLVPSGGLVGSAFGQLSVQGVNSNVFTLASALNAWFQETAGARYARLCAEEGINCRIIGPTSRSQPMGNQTLQTIPSLLQEIETTDQGLQFEPRQTLGLGYVTNWALCQQPALVSADYSLAQPAAGIVPSSDDQLTINDVTFTSGDGSSSRQVLTSGPMSTASPPGGVGRFDTSVTVNPQADTLLASLANWFLHIRSVNEDRYPAIPFDMARTETPAAVPLLDIGSYLQVINMPSWIPAGPAKLLAAGFRETLGPFGIWKIDVNGIPESPYETGIVADPVYGHADTDGSALAQAVTSGATTLQVATLSSFPAWTTAGGDLPFDIKVGYGEQNTVTAIAAAAQLILFSDDFETGVSGWTPSNCTFAQSGAQHHTGSFSGLMTPISSPSFMWVTDNTAIPMPPAATCEAAGWLFSTGTPLCYMELDFFDVSNNLLLKATATAVALVASTWTFMGTIAQAPAGTSYCKMLFVSQAPGTNTVFVDGAGTSVTTQQFTVTRGVNGVQVAHNVGEDIRLAHPMIVALGS